MDILFYYSDHRRFFLLSSIGYDVVMIFCYYNRNMIWLTLWLLVGLLNSRQSFGYGPTQSSFVHIGIACALSVLHDCP